MLRAGTSSFHAAALRLRLFDLLVFFLGTAMASSSVVSLDGLANDSRHQPLPHWLPVVVRSFYIYAAKTTHDPARAWR